jgi:hypothetical protein
MIRSRRHLDRAIMLEHHGHDKYALLLLLLLVWTATPAEVGVGRLGLH